MAYAIHTLHIYLYINICLFNFMPKLVIQESSRHFVVVAIVIVAGWLAGCLVNIVAVVVISVYFSLCSVCMSVFRLSILFVLGCYRT